MNEKVKLTAENAEMAMSDMTKIIKYSATLQKMFTPNDDLEDWVKAKLNHAADYIATVRDYLKFYHNEKSIGTSDQEINEKWTRSYKKRIDRAGQHTKSSSVSEVEVYNEVLKDLIEDILEEESSMAMGAVKQINNDAQELQSILKPNMQLPDWCKAKLNLAGEYLDDVYHHLDHFGPQGRKLDEGLNEPESDLTPSFYREKDRRMRNAVRPVIPEIAFWVSPTGEFIKVGDHEQWVIDNRDKIVGFNRREPLTSAFRNGYVRLVYKPQDDFVNLHNSGEDDGTNRFYVNGNPRNNIPPLTSQSKDAIRQFIGKKNVLVVVDDRGTLRIDDIMNESWGKTLSTAALAASMFGTPDVQAATKANKPVASNPAKSTSEKMYVNVDKITTSSAAQKYTLKNEGAVRNFYLIDNKPHIGGGHHLDGSSKSRTNIRHIASLKNENPKTNEQLLKYAEGGPAIESAFSDVVLSNEQISVLFSYDYNDKVDLAKKLYKNFDKFPASVQTMLVDSIFRGEKHPKTDKLVNGPTPNWNQVADEYLNDAEYKQSKAEGSGVSARMDRNAKLLRHASETKSNNSGVVNKSGVVKKKNESI